VITATVTRVARRSPDDRAGWSARPGGGGGGPGGARACAEDRLTAVTDAVRVLAHGLEDLPMAEPGGRSAAGAARRAYELLLLAEPHRPGPQVASPEA